jgi:hypothetical protein
MQSISPQIGLLFRYSRWNSYHPTAKPLECWNGIVTSFYWDELGELVVIAQDDCGEEHIFWNSSFLNSGFYESLEFVWDKE